MATYLILNVITLTVVVAVFIFLRQRIVWPMKTWCMTFAALLFLTLIFDNLLIMFDMYRYTPDKILGFSIWLAPIEDFMYPLLAVIAIPAIWNTLGESHAYRH